MWYQLDAWIFGAENVGFISSTNVKGNVINVLMNI